MKNNKKKVDFSKFGNGSNHRKDLIQAIKKTNCFIVDIKRQNFFNDAQCIVQAEIAKEFNKKFNIVLKDGLLIPDKYLAGIQKYKVFTWKTKKDYDNIFFSLLNTKEDLIIENAYST